MKILLVEPGKKPVLSEIDGSLKSMQEVVGGTIQAIFPFEEPVALICNDEGKLLGLPLFNGSSTFIRLCCKRMWSGQNKSDSTMKESYHRRVRLKRRTLLCVICGVGFSRNAEHKSKYH